jgi:hypothetical protein
MWPRVYSFGALRQVLYVCGLINAYLCLLIRHLLWSGAFVVAQRHSTLYHSDCGLQKQKYDVVGCNHKKKIDLVAVF